MATGGDSQILNCAICFERKTKKNPRCLLCQHSFCLSCIEKWHKTSVSQGQEDPAIVKCPVCRQQTRLPAGGISSLPFDFKVSEVAEILKGSKSEFLCQTCSQNGLSKPMKAMCKTCNRRLCQECISRHKGVKIFSSHVIVDDLCADHKASVEYICLKCTERLCTDCVLGESHQDHNIIQINEAETEIKAPLKHTRLKAVEKELYSTKESIISSPFSCNFGETLEDIKKKLKPRLQLKVPFGPGQPVEFAYQIRILPNGSVIVNDHFGPARKLSKEGEWGAVYGEKQHRTAICVYNDNIYIAPRTGNALLKYASDGGVETFQMIPSLQKVHQIQVYENDVFLLSINMGIEHRSLQNCSSRKMLISQIGLCSFLRVPFGKSYQFFCANLRREKVDVFDESGNLLNTIGSNMLQSPTDVKLLGNGNIIVADNDHDRILEFHTNGTFVRELLTKEDGLCNPNDMDYLHPYLWVTQGEEDMAILLYKFT